MQKKLIVILITVLAILVAALAIVNRRGAMKTEGLVFITEKEEVSIPWTKIQRTSFEGDLKNGKGEVSHHLYEGAALVDLLSEAGLKLPEDAVLTAKSEDNYSATLTGAEVLEEGKVYVALSQDGEMIEGIEGGQGAQLIVFGDENSKRAVRYLKVISLTEE